MAINSFGTVFMFGTDSASVEKVGQLTSIGELTCDSEEIDVTTLDSAGGYREYMQGYRDAGVISIEGYHDTNDNGQASMKEAYASGEVGDAVIEFPDGSRADFKAYVKSYTLGAAKVDGAVGFGAALRITGGVAFTRG